MLEEFRRFFVGKKSVHENAVPWCARWVASCYEFYQLDFSEPLTDKQNQDFIDNFAKNHEEWQVRQAKEALRLFKIFRAPARKATTTADKIAQNGKPSKKAQVIFCGSNIGLATLKKPTCPG